MRSCLLLVDLSILFQSYPGIVVESLLDAMHRGSEDAQQRFPRILQLVERYPETQSQLTDKVDTLQSDSY